MTSEFLVQVYFVAGIAGIVVCFIALFRLLGWAFERFRLVRFDFLNLVGIILIGISLPVLALVFWLELWDVLRAKTWHETSCHIESARVRINPRSGRSPEGYQIIVSYNYTVPEGRFAGSRYGFGSKGGPYRSIEQAQGVLSRLQPGTLVSCFFNPSDPSESVIDRTDQAGFLPWIGWAVIFLPGAAMCLVSFVLALFRTDAAAKPVTPRPEDPRESRRILRWVLVALTSALLLGLGLIFWKHWQRVSAAQAWVETTCHIRSIDIRFSPGGFRGYDSYTHDIIYSYSTSSSELGGRRYRFLLSGYLSEEAAREALGGLTPGTVVPCYFDPDNPADSVIDARTGDWANHLVWRIFGPCFLLLACFFVVSFIPFKQKTLGKIVIGPETKVKRKRKRGRQR